MAPAVGPGPSSSNQRLPAPDPPAHLRLPLSDELAAVLSSSSFPTILLSDFAVTSCRAAAHADDARDEPFLITGWAAEGSGLGFVGGRQTRVGRREPSPHHDLPEVAQSAVSATPPHLEPPPMNIIDVGTTGTRWAFDWTAVGSVPSLRVCQSGRCRHANCRQSHVQLGVSVELGWMLPVDVSVFVVFDTFSRACRRAAWTEDAPEFVRRVCLCSWQT
jgi:hypothetical protein